MKYNPIVITADLFFYAYFNIYSVFTPLAQFYDTCKFSVVKLKINQGVHQVSGSYSGWPDNRPLFTIHFRF